MTDQWWSSARQPPGAVPFRNKFDAARDPLSARVAIGAVDAKYVADAIAAAGGGGGGGAPTTAEYVTAASDATLTAERVLTNTASITWDFSTPGQAKATAVGGGNVSNSGTPTSGQYAKWVTSTTIQGVAPATVLSDIGAQPAGSYQPLDADLTSLAAAAGLHTIYYRSAANTWSPVTIGANLTFSSGTLAATGGGTASTTDIGLNCGRLTYLSSTALQFLPYNGDRIRINGTIYAIPLGGIAGLSTINVFKEGVALQTLSASTLYYVYAFNNGGTITADYSTTGHVMSIAAGNCGTEIKSGPDETRTLIGMVYTNPSGQFQNTDALRCVISWFNRRNIRFLGVQTNGASSASTSSVEINGGTSRAYFLTWAEEAVHAGLIGTATNTTTVSHIISKMWLDGVDLLARDPSDQIVVANGFNQQSSTANFTTTEALHYVTPAGHVLGGTGQWYVYVTGMIRG